MTTRKTNTQTKTTISILDIADHIGVQAGAGVVAAGVGVLVGAITILGKIKMVAVMENITTIVTGKTTINNLTKAALIGGETRVLTHRMIILWPRVRCPGKDCHRWSGTRTTLCMCLAARRYTPD